MASREWGFLCPVDGGLLLALKGTDMLHCPDQRHHGRPKTHPLGPTEPSPAFFHREQVKEGYTVAAKYPSGSGLSESQIRQMHNAAATDPDSDAVAEAAVNGGTAAVKVRKGKAPIECLCGCGGMTQGGKFLPGHDARLHAAEKAGFATVAEHVAAKAAEAAAKAAAKAKPAEAVTA